MDGAKCPYQPGKINDVKTYLLRFSAATQEQESKTNAPTSPYHRIVTQGQPVLILFLLGQKSWQENY